MSMTGLAALIAAVSFAVLTLTAVIIAIRVSGLLGAAGALIKETKDGQESLLARANAAVERTNSTLDRTETVTSSMDKLGSGMNELSDQVNALAGFGRTMAGAVVTGPAGKAAAVAYGVRHAVVLRRGGQRTLSGEVVAEKRTQIGAASPAVTATATRAPGAVRSRKKGEIEGAEQAPRSVRDKKKARP